MTNAYSIKKIASKATQMYIVRHNGLLVNAVVFADAVCSKGVLAMDITRYPQPTVKDAVNAVKYEIMHQRKYDG